MGLKVSLDFVLMLNCNERELFQQLAKTYTPDADAFCGSLVQKLESAAERHTADLCEHHLPHAGTLNLWHLASNMDGVVFLARVSEELSTASPFISCIGCRQFVAEGCLNLHLRVSLF